MNTSKADFITIFISGRFEILHPGHLRLFHFAKELGDKLVIGVLSDALAEEETKEHIIPEDLRLEALQSNSSIDEVILIKDSVAQTIKRLKPDYVVKGKEHQNTFNEELEAVETYGGRLVFSSGEVVFSSLNLLKNLSEVQPKVANLPTDFLSRHNITKENLINIIQGFSKLEVCIVGDLIIDEYISCDPLGMSQEEPAIVVKPLESKKYLGGAGIVAAHAASLGAKVHYFGVCGKDEIGDFAQKKLSEYGVNANLFFDESRPTTLKKRYKVEDRTLLRVSYLHQDSVDKKLQDRLSNEIKAILPSCSLLVFSDFNYGCLPQNLVDNIIDEGKSLDLIMTADSQTSSQTGDVSRFKDMELLMPTEREARVALRNQEDGLVILLDKLRERSNAKNIILKLGLDGALLSIIEEDLSPQTDRIQALNSSPRDIMGAGDSMLIGASMALASPEVSPWKAACIASVMAAVQVSQTGNIPLNLDTILREIKD